MPFGLFESVKRFKNQNYSTLKKDCQKKGTLFIDTEFPPDDRSLFHTQSKVQNVVWKRPKQICDDPHFFVDGTDSGDVHQGRLGNCWFVAACSCLAQYKEILNKVIPDAKGQEWDKEKPDEYAGIFRFQFWRYGEWTEVVIDDFLPTVNDELVFIHSQSRNEFWSALLEKAYAKLFGTYESLDGGELSEALEDFTGGVSETYDMVSQNVANQQEEQVALFARLKKDSERKSLMAASIPPNSQEEMEACTEMGLVKGHAYGITAVKNIALDGTGIFGLFNREKLRMIRLRNPWGKCEWKGAFSDGSEEWNKISKADREKLGLEFEDDGEFWMTFEDFVKNFVNVAVCRVVNTSFFSLNKTWHEGLHHGSWSSPGLAGGCMNNRDTFLQNPQYAFDVTEDEDEVLIQLSQKSTRTSKEGSVNETIGFTILKCEQNREYRMHDLNLFSKEASSVFRNSRSIFLRQKLTKGRYVVVPSTFEPGKVLDFLVRIYTSSGNNFKHLSKDKPVKSWWNCCAGAPKLVTQIKVIGAQGLEKQELSGADPYCIISCEGHKVTTPVRKDNLNPEWNTWALFYRRDPLKKPIKFEIWNHNIVRDEHMGTYLYLKTENCGETRLEVPLADEKDATQARPGKLILQITQNSSLLTI